jgi:hypothetical protein
MFSLLCEVLCVLAQLTNSAVHPTAMLLRKRRVVGFIVICRGTKSMERLQPCTHIHRSLIGFLSLRQNPNFDVGCWVVGVCLSSSRSPAFLNS